MRKDKNPKILKSYFLKDEAIKSLDKDKFRHQDIANNLRTIIENTEPPFNVAIIGKWGLGKSSLINMVIDPFKKENEKYLVQEINAWKYEKESLCKVFLKQLWNSINGKKVKSFETIKREVSEIFNIDEPKTDLKSLYKKSALIMGTIVLSTFILLIAYKGIQGVIFGFQSKSFFDFLGRAILSYCKNIATVLVLPIAVAGGKILLDQINEKQTKKIELNFPLETADDYEIMLETQIAEKLKENPNLKVITVIDDLDRLSLHKIVEALDALKTFINLDRCIFIVPFDDSILKSALESARLNKLSIDNKLIESELVIDKLFQFKMYLPPLLEYDIKKFAIELCIPNMKDFIREYCTQPDFEKVIRNVLMHNNVTTPRQVKKIVNLFATNLMLAVNRENKGQLNKSFASSIEGKLMIAKVSVLQADFNEFYDLLFKNLNYLHEILELHQSKDCKKITNDLIHYFEKNENGEYKIKEEHLPLINFLSKTEKYNLDNIASYLYVAQDEVSILTGDENQKKFIAATNSGDFQTARELLLATPDLAKALEYRIINTDDGVDLCSFVLASINLFDVISESLKLHISEALSERNKDVISNSDSFEFSKLDFDNIFTIISLDSNNAMNNILNEYLGDNVEIKKETFLNSLPIFFKNEKLLSDITTNLLIKRISLVLNDKKTTIKQLFDTTSKISDVQFEKYFGQGYFQLVCRELDEENDFSKFNLEQLSWTLNKLLNAKISLENLLKDCANLFNYPALIPTLQDSFKSADLSNVSEEISKSIYETIILIDISKCINQAFAFLSKLSCSITEDDDSEKYDNFYSNNLGIAGLELVLNKFGECNGDFEFIPKTVTSLTNSIFTNSGNDLIFAKNEQFYTTEQKTTLFTALTTYCSFTQNKNYERETAILKVLMNNNVNSTAIAKMFSDSIFPSFSSYHNYPGYIAFSTNAVIICASVLSKANITTFISTCVSAISYSADTIISACDKIANYITDDDFKIIAPTIIQYVTEDNYEEVYSLFVKKESAFTNKNISFTVYTDFLIGKLELSNNPNIVLKKINSYFGSISNNNIVTLASKVKSSRHNIENTFFISTVAKFIDKITDNTKTIEVLLNIVEIDFSYANQIVKLIKTHNPIDLCTKISDDINNYTNTQLLSLLKLLVNSIDEINVAQAVKIMEQIFSEHSNPDLTSQICNLMIENPRTFGKNKKMYCIPLYNCFHITSSQEIKNSILQAVKSLRMTKEFKSNCTDDEKQILNNSLN